MTGLAIKSPTHTDNVNFALGKHQDWECSAHECEDEYFQKSGQLWSYDYRKKWLERYFSITPHVVAHALRDCRVCVKLREQELVHPAETAKAVRVITEQVHALSRRLASKLTTHSKRIDAF